MENAAFLNGIIERYDDFRVEYTETQFYFDPETGDESSEEVLVSKFPLELSLEDYDAFKKGHPNYIICQTLCKYLKEELGIRLKYTSKVMQSFLDLFKYVYHRAHLARGNYDFMQMPPYPDNVVPQTFWALIPMDVHECLEDRLIRGSIVCMLLQIDTTVNLTVNEIALADKLYTRHLINEKEIPFYKMLGDALRKAFPDQLNCLDPKISKVFKCTNEYFRQKVADAIKLCKKKSDYALLELSLQDCMQIKTTDKHKAFIDALVAWGLVDERENQSTYTNMKEKYAALVRGNQNDWSDKDKKKYEALTAHFTKK